MQDFMNSQSMTNVIAKKQCSQLHLKILNKAVLFFLNRYIFYARMLFVFSAVYVTVHIFSKQSCPSGFYAHLANIFNRLFSE